MLNTIHRWCKVHCRTVGWHNANSGLLHGPGGISIAGQARPHAFHGCRRWLTGRRCGTHGARLLALRTHHGELLSPPRIRPPDRRRRRRQESPRAPPSLEPTGTRSTEPRAATAALVLRRVGPRRRHPFSLSFPAADREVLVADCFGSWCWRSKRREQRLRAYGVVNGDGRIRLVIALRLVCRTRVK